MDTTFLNPGADATFLKPWRRHGHRVFRESWRGHGRGHGVFQKSWRGHGHGHGVKPVST